MPTATNMIMKQLNIKILVCIISLLSIGTISAQQAPHEAYAQHIESYRNAWQTLIPRYIKAQYAGGMGIASVGVGWDYGKNRQWETDLLFGLIPRYSSESAKLTMTLKENFTPWTVHINDKFDFQPLETGLYFNTVFSNKFWTHEPGRYPRGYYGFSTRLRTHIFIGQRWRFNIPEHRYIKSVSAFYELSTCDLYLVSAVQNSYMKPADYLRLSFGVKLQIL